MSRHVLENWPLILLSHGLYTCLEARANNIMVIARARARANFTWTCGDILTIFLSLVLLYCKL